MCYKHGSFSYAHCCYNQHNTTHVLILKMEANKMAITTEILASAAIFIRHFVVLYSVIFINFLCICSQIELFLHKMPKTSMLI